MGGFGILGHPWVQSDVKASLGYMSRGLKKNHKEGILLVFYGTIKITG